MYSNEIQLVLRPSQWINLKWFVLGMGGTALLSPLGPVALLPLVIPLWKVIEVFCWTYEFGEETVVESRGVFDVTRNEVHYYRIKSIQVDEPLQLGILGLGNVHLITSDQFTRSFTFEAVDRPEELRELLRELTFIQRQDKGTKEFDLYDL